LGQGNVYLRRVLLSDGSQVAACRIATKNSSEEKPKWNLFVVKSRNPSGSKLLGLPAPTIPIDKDFMDIVIYAADDERWIPIYQAKQERDVITEAISATTSQLPAGNGRKSI
jgi:hypothetical protein